MNSAVLRADLPPLDLGGYPEINCEGVCDFYRIGDRVRFILFDWCRVEGIFQRKIAGTVSHHAQWMTPGSAEALERRFSPFRDLCN